MVRFSIKEEYETKVDNIFLELTNQKFLNYLKKHDNSVIDYYIDKKKKEVGEERMTVPINVCHSRTLNPIPQCSTSLSKEKPKTFDLLDSFHEPSLHTLHGSSRIQLAFVRLNPHSHSFCFVFYRKVYKLGFSK